MTSATLNQATETYNGWANYETWNVALWLQNDYALYKFALRLTMEIDRTLEIYYTH